MPDPVFTPEDVCVRSNIIQDNDYSKVAGISIPYIYLAFGPKNNKELPQNPNLHTSLDHFCHTKRKYEPVSCQKYPAKKTSRSLFSTPTKGAVVKRCVLFIQRSIIRPKMIKIDEGVQVF